MAIHPQYQKYLKFYWKGVLYKYIVMPFGLCSAPRIFTKLLKPPLSILRTQGIVINMYLDDSWQIGLSYDEAVLVTTRVYELFVKCGFLPNHKKSVLIPTQKLDALGFTLGSVSMTITISAEKTY